MRVYLWVRVCACECVKPEGWNETSGRKEMDVSIQKELKEYM